MDVTADVGGSRGDADTPLTDRRVGGAFALSPETGQSIDERLAAMLELIRSWDWRSASVAEERTFRRLEPPMEGRAFVAGALPERRAVPPPPSSPPPPPSPPPAPPPVRLQPPEPEVGFRHPVPAADQTVMPVPTLVRYPPVREPSWQPVGAEAGPVTVESDARTYGGPPAGSAPLTDVMPSTVAEVPTSMVPVDQAPGLDESVPPEQDSPSPSSRRRYGKLLLWVIAVVVVIIIVEIIRVSAPSPNSDTLTPTTVTSTTAPVASIAVSRAVKTQFESASTTLDAANVTLTQALASSSGQSVAQVAQEVAPYVTALNTFQYELHFIAWPEAMQVPSEDLTLRTQTLVTFLASVSSANSSTLTSWTAQLHALAAKTQTADNLVRKDIGMSATTSYP